MERLNIIRYVVETNRSVEPHHIPDASYEWVAIENGINQTFTPNYTSELHPIECDADPGMPNFRSRPYTIRQSLVRNNRMLHAAQGAAILQFLGGSLGVTLTNSKVGHYLLESLGLQAIRFRDTSDIDLVLVARIWTRRIASSRSDVYYPTEF